MEREREKEAEESRNNGFPPKNTFCRIEGDEVKLIYKPHGGRNALRQQQKSFDQLLDLLFKVNEKLSAGKEIN